MTTFKLLWLGGVRWGLLAGGGSESWSQYSWSVTPSLLVCTVTQGRHTKNSGFLSGRTTKGEGRVNPPYHKAKNHFFLKFGCFSPKIGKKKKKLSISVSGYYKTKKNHYCREGITLVVRPLKKTLVSSLSYY